MPRTITVVLSIQDEQEARVYWDAHIRQQLVKGAKVLKISNGDLTQKIDEYEKTLDKHSKWLDN